ncbi:hypothetical protein SJAG_00316 [Schizosaccharomyces japonicus yFS275]|uniref:Uncharacterized protein n=1 Tax=Schizosaccharomyces japonicus (strain yFS275 / FY16936) TaxID=402676 RepID=B6JVA9_SCHJY|nr:hypothetical protein SJAG_00316 [Schizosaccharomyces japonicus yFS275]EEB05310.1 hypothetical protein SJAG_00316 [Schizosaccharomyces japonicus yFS275]
MDELFQIDLEFEPDESKQKREARLQNLVSQNLSWEPRIQDFGHLTKNNQVVATDEKYLTEQAKFAAEEQYYLRNYEKAIEFAKLAIQLCSSRDKDNSEKCSSIQYHRLSHGEMQELDDLIVRSKRKIEALRL